MSTDTLAPPSPETLTLEKASSTLQQFQTLVNIAAGNAGPSRAQESYPPNSPNLRLQLAKFGLDLSSPTPVSIALLLELASAVRSLSQTDPESPELKAFLTFAPLDTDQPITLETVRQALTSPATGTPSSPR